MGLFLLSLALGYGLIILQYLYFWKKIPKQDYPPPSPLPSISLVLAFRNEAQHLRTAVLDLVQQNYPQSKLEILLIDDHSQDQSSSLISDLLTANPQLHLLQLPQGQQGKKAALTLGLQQAKNTWIVCTDADCRYPRNWLHRLMSQQAAQQSQVLVGMVSFEQQGDFLTAFQRLEGLGMMLLTGAGLQAQNQWLCNGANWAYQKALFEQIKGFEGLTHRASGDDVMLLQKMRQAKAKIHFVPDTQACVQTQATANYRAFWQQRLRWASKNTEGFWANWGNTWRSAWVFAFCLGLSLQTLALPWTYAQQSPFVLAAWALKAAADALLLYQAARFFEEIPLFKRYFWPSLPFHTAYIAALGCFSLFKKSYVWKNRHTQVLFCIFNLVLF